MWNAIIFVSRLALLCQWCSCAGHFTLGLGIGTSKLSVLVLENNVHEIPYILLE